MLCKSPVMKTECHGYSLPLKRRRWIARPTVGESSNFEWQSKIYKGPSRSLSQSSTWLGWVNMNMVVAWAWDAVRSNGLFLLFVEKINCQQSKGTTGDAFHNRSFLVFGDRNRQAEQRLHWMLRCPWYLFPRNEVFLTKLGRWPVGCSLIQSRNECETVQTTWIALMVD